MTHALQRLTAGRSGSAIGRTAIVLVILALFGAADARAQCPLDPNSPITIANPGVRYNDEGNTVSVPIVATHTNPQVILTWNASGLPQDLRINASTGVVSGTLAPGSAGSYAVHVIVNGSDGSGNCVDFVWKVSEWLLGDLFMGLADGSYAWWSRDAQPKGSVLVDSGQIMTGCASDWRNGDLFATNFAFSDSHPGAFRVPATPPRDSNTIEFFDSHRPADPAGELHDTAPESVALALDGTVYVGHADGFYVFQKDPQTGNTIDPVLDGYTPWLPADKDGSPLVRGWVFVPGVPAGSWQLLDGSDEWIVAPALDGSGHVMAGVPGSPILDAGGNPLRYSAVAIGHYFVDATGQPLLDTDGSYRYAGKRAANGLPYWHQDLPAYYQSSIPIHKLPAGTMLRPYYEDTLGHPRLGPGGALIPARLQDGRDLQVWRPDGSGGWLRSVYTPLVNAKGTDWIDLSSDQRTIFYTSEYNVVHRFDTVTGTQLPPFAVVSESSLFALRLLPPGDGTGGLLAAALRHVVRLNGAGRTVMTYQGRMTCPEDPNGCPDPGHFAVTIDPGMRVFWTGSYFGGDMYEFDIRSGEKLAGPVPNAGPGGGLCAKLEYTAAQEICGNFIDDDGDGLIDENCTPLEICSPYSPGDDDGNGLIDLNDPACSTALTQAEICGDGIDNNNDGRIDEGVCPRSNVEGDQVLVYLGSAPINRPSDQYVVSGLPPGLTLDSATGAITGTVACSAVMPPAKTQAYHVAVTITDPTTSASGTGAFTWTIADADCAPVAGPDAYVTNEDTPLTVSASGVLGNDSDLDGDPLSSAVLTGPAHGSLTLKADGSFTYTPAPDYNGTDGFTYTVSDGRGGTSTGTVTVAVTPVNDAPSFSKGSDQTVLEDAGAQTVSGWASNITAGPPDEAGQTLSFNITANSNPGLFATQPAISPGGILTFTPAPNANGSATVTVVLKDNGGTANGGVDTSAPRTFTITVLPVNDPPVFVKGPDQTVLVSAGAQTVPNWATGISPGPSNEAGQTVTFSVTGNTKPSLFSVQPVVASNGSLTYTPAAGASGTATITVVATDNGGTLNGGVNTSAPQTFTITVVANRPPVCSAATAKPATIWPPNHQFVPITINGVTDPDKDKVTLKVTSIFQDEPTNTDGDGDDTPDGKGVGTATASVRAERSGTNKTPGNGRVYTISFTAADSKGASCSGVVKVCVPHDQGSQASCVDDGPNYDSTKTWPALPGHDEDHCSVPDHDHSKGKKDKDDDRDRFGVGLLCLLWR